VVFVVRLVEYRIITERNIADDDIKIIVGDLCFLINYFFCQDCRN
jgi:hypothetical protein